MNWDAYVYDLPLARPYVWAKGTSTRRQGLLVSVRQGDTVGWGEVAFPPHENPDLAEAARQLLKAADAWTPQSDVELHPRIRSGISGAWWDLAARRELDPLSRQLAEHVGLDATARVVKANALIEALPPSEAASRAMQLVAAGFTTLKIKSDGTLPGDIARLDAIRQAVGEKITLRLDANEAWDPATAVDHLEKLARFDLQYVEQPLPARDRAGLLRLAAKLSVPIALDESATSWDDIAWYQAQGVPFHVIAKPQRLGGPDAAAQFLAHCHDHGLRVTVTNSLETAVGRSHALHVAALLGDSAPACGLATASFLAHDVSPEPRDEPRMSVAQRGGLGITVETGGLRHVVP